MTEHQQNSLPSSLHNEIAILGAMLLDAIAISDATAKLRSEDFSLDSHQRIYRAILGLMSDNHAVDFLTVQDYLAKKRELDAVGGPAYLAYLTEGIPRNLNIESYVRIVKDKSLLRQLHAIGEDLSARALDQGEGAATVLADIEQRLGEVADTSIERGFCSMGSIVAGSFGSIDALYEQGRDITGLETHFVDFDRMTGGLQNGDLIIIAARPSMGKSAFCINIAQSCSLKDGKVVAIFSLEMSKESLLKRILSSESSINGRSIQSGMMQRHDRDRLHSALERIIDSKMFVDDSPNIGLAEMRAKCRRLKQQEGRLDLIEIDYLQLMGGDFSKGKRNAENRTQEVSAISRGLKALAKEMGCPVVALSQLSRDVEKRADKKPLLSDLRESGSIEQDADVVAFIHRAEYYDPKNEDLKGKAEIIIAKQRQGPTGSVDLAYVASCTRFVNVASEYSATGSLDPEWTGNAY
jgi:replicative DNA helicase